MKTATIAKKALIFGSSLLVASTMFLTTSCDNKDDEGGDVTPVTPVDQNVLKGDITKDMTLDASKVYSLVGAVHVKEGATLTIPAGTMIKADLTGTVAYLLIEKGAKIMAEGTVDKPIVFTSSAAIPRRRDWGGIIINGKAPINVTGGEAATEISPEIKYGGTVADDNSGMLKYVRVEYAGNSINEEKEHNTVTFNGVGNKTVVEYVQAYMGGDDGFEFFGGTVNTKYLISTASGDDLFDWKFGLVGQNEYWYGEQANEMGDC